MRGDRRQKFLQLDAQSLGFDNQFFHFLSQQFGALLPARIGQLRHHRANARQRLQQTLANQIGDNLVRCIGLIFSSLLKVRTDGNASPGRSWPAIIAFFAA